MAFHIECKPEARNNPQFSVFDSKYDGTCAGCQSAIEVGQKIAYFKKTDGGSNNSPAGAPRGGNDSKELSELRKELNALRKELSEVKRMAKHADDLAIHVNGQMIIMNAGPKRKQAEVPASPEQAAQIFEGKPVESADAAY